MRGPRNSERQYFLFISPHNPFCSLNKYKILYLAIITYLPSVEKVSGNVFVTDDLVSVSKSSNIFPVYAFLA